jgi:hypothetical protein
MRYVMFLDYFLIIVGVRFDRCDRYGTRLGFPGGRVFNFDRCFNMLGYLIAWSRVLNFAESTLTENFISCFLFPCDFATAHLNI